MGGYRWEKVDEKQVDPGARPVHFTIGREEFVLTDGVDVRAGSYYKNYYPLHENAALWRTFAETPPTPEGIAAFAGEYGLLGPPASVSVHIGQSRVIAEPLRYWVQQIDSMRMATRVWNLARKGKKKELRKIVKCDPGKRISLLYEEESRRCELTVAEEHLNPDLLDLKPSHIDRLALAGVQTIINRNTQEILNTFPAVAWTKNLTRLQLFLSPNSLIAALWLQFAQAVGNNADFRECLCCEEWFEVSLNARRADARFCSDKCKQKDYRHRKKARKLRGEGMKLRDIAGKLDTTLPRVRRLLKES